MQSPLLTLWASSVNPRLYSFAHFSPHVQIIPFHSVMWQRSVHEKEGRKSSSSPPEQLITLKTDHFLFEGSQESLAFALNLGFSKYKNQTHVPYFSLIQQRIMHTAASFEVNWRVSASIHSWFQFWFGNKTSDWTSCCCCSSYLISVESSYCTHKHIVSTEKCLSPSSYFDDREDNLHMSVLSVGKVRIPQLWLFPSWYHKTDHETSQWSFNQDIIADGFKMSV